MCKSLSPIFTLNKILLKKMFTFKQREIKKEKKKKELKVILKKKKKKKKE